MGGERARALLGWLEQREPEAVALLERLVAAESPSQDAAAQQRALSILVQELEQTGYVVRLVNGAGSVRHLYGRPARRRHRAPYQLVVGHVDTVWPVGTLAAMPVRREGDTLFGPGTYDMKAGLVQLVFALRALQALDLVPTVTPVLLVNADEEIGSGGSERLLRLLGRHAVRAFVLEGGDGAEGRLKIARKGVGRYTLTVRGRAAHVGTEFERGTSAILELSHQIQRLFALNDGSRGVTVNVGTIDGGLRPNVVAPEASASIGVRSPTETIAREIDLAIRSLEPVVEGCSLEVEGNLGRPPMEPTRRNRALLATAQRLGDELGLTLEDAGLVGGGSDANTLSLCTATLDGLGPVGGGAHSVDEHVRISSLGERAALIAMLLLEPPTQRSRAAGRRRKARLIVASSGENETSVDLARVWSELGVGAELVSPGELQARLRAGDTVLGRLDVLPTLDGVEPGLFELLRAERRGFRVLNPAAVLLTTHDKLRTARLLEHAGLAHPRAVHVGANGALPRLAFPVVVKPRFGSWGKDVVRCRTAGELARCLQQVRSRPWFRRHGALVQELVQPRGYDLRVIVAGGRAVGAIERVAAPGEWRTNISLGGSKRPCVPSPAAAALAVAAAEAARAALVGVDLLPVGSGYTILELNGAVEFDAEYSYPGCDVYAEIVDAFGPRANRTEHVLTLATR